MDPFEEIEEEDHLSANTIVGHAIMADKTIVYDMPRRENHLTFLFEHRQEESPTNPNILSRKARETSSTIYCKLY